MERPSVCPACLSKYEDIRGMVYPAGSFQGATCKDSWHRGAEYPNELQLTPEDQKFLAWQYIKA